MNLPSCGEMTMMTIAHTSRMIAGTMHFFKISVYFSMPTTCAAKIPASAVGGIMSPQEAIREMQMDTATL